MEKEGGGGGVLCFEWGEGWVNLTLKSFRYFH